MSSANVPPPLGTPTAAECRALREGAGLSLAAMAHAARLADRQTWAKYEANRQRCDPARWEWCLLLLGRHPHLQALPLAQQAPQAPAAGAFAPPSTSLEAQAPPPSTNRKAAQRTPSTNQGAPAHP